MIYPSCKLETQESQWYNLGQSKGLRSSGANEVNPSLREGEDVMF